MLLLCSILVGCGHLRDHEDTTPLIGTWKVIKGMTVEDQKTGYAEIIFRNNREYQASYDSPGWRSVQKAKWKVISDIQVAVTGVSLHTKFGKMENIEELPDFIILWSIHEDGKLILQTSNSRLVLERIR